MKNVTSVVEREEIHEYLLRLWRSDIFRDSHRSGGIIHDIVESFAWLPRLFAEMTNDNLERPHFATWWNVIMLRPDYGNPFVHDLYYLHELAHAASMTYMPEIGRKAFDDKMQRNELEASVLSEIQIYFELPRLRESSFHHTIYADRFLSDRGIGAIWNANKTIAVETLRTMRKNVMVSKPEHLMDHTEKWIRRFADQNTAFSHAWADSYNGVETHMGAFQVMAAMDRRAGAEMHLQWVTDLAARDSRDNIPFRTEAETFAPHYWDNKARYDLEMNA